MDLFSGTGSVGKVFRDMGYEVITVDFDGRRKPSIVADVTIWQYWKAFPPRHFDVVACCPPCTEFSRAMTSRPRDLSKANKALKTALDIVDRLQPTLWFLENPRTGVLKDREYMQGIPYVDLDYCMFSKWGYQKPTLIWGSPAMKKLAHVECNGGCGNMSWNANGRWTHWSKLGTTPDPGRVKPSQTEAYRVPERLVLYLLQADPTLVPTQEENSRKMGTTVLMDEENPIIAATAQVVPRPNPETEKATSSQADLSRLVSDSDPDMPQSDINLPHEGPSAFCDIDSDSTASDAEGCDFEESDHDMPVQRLVHYVKGLRLTTEDHPEREFMN